MELARIRKLQVKYQSANSVQIEESSIVTAKLPLSSKQTVGFPVIDVDENSCTDNSSKGGDEKRSQVYYKVIARPSSTLEPASILVNP